MRYWLLAALIAVSASMPPAGAQQPPTPWLSLPRPADSGKAIIYDPQLAAKADQEALSGCSLALQCRLRLLGVIERNGTVELRAKAFTW